MLKGMRDVAIPGLTWVIGDGKSIRFWKDRWMMQEPLLLDARTEIPTDLVDVQVSELWQ